MPSELRTTEWLSKELGEPLELIDDLCIADENFPLGEVRSVKLESGDFAFAIDNQGIEELRELIADIKTWPGGTDEYLADVKMRDAAFETSKKGAAE